MEASDPEESAKRIYADWADLETRLRLQERHRSHPENWYRWVFERLELPEGGRLLELGCGLGHLWDVNRDRPLGNGKFVLSDLPGDSLREARRRLQAAFTAQGAGIARPADFCSLDGLALPFSDQAFDTVIALGVFDHIPDLSRSFREIRRVLKPGGWLFASAGGKEHLREMEELVDAFVEGIQYGGDPDRFGIENGAALLSPWFQTVEREMYEDRLRFEKAQPLLEYLLSEPRTRAVLKGEVLAGFVNYLKQKIAKDRRLYVTSRKCLFRAQKTGA